MCALLAEVRSLVNRKSEIVNLLGFIPIPAQPVGHEANGRRVENFFFAESRHSIIAFAEVIRVRGIRDQADEPIARPIARELRALGRPFAAKLVTIGAAHVSFEQRLAFGDERRVVLVAFALGGETRLGGQRGDHLDRKSVV